MGSEARQRMPGGKRFPGHCPYCGRKIEELSEEELLERRRGRPYPYLE